MAFRYKRFYLTSGSILGILLLIAPFIQYYYGYEEEIYCEDKCFVRFCIKNGNKNLYFYNKGELPLTFYPEDKVSNVKFYKKDGRYKSGYREIDFIKPYTKNRLYVFKIPAYSFTCYAMEIEKEWWADVKWSFGGTLVNETIGELDPMLLSGVEVGDKIVKELCKPIYKTWTDKTYYYKTCIQKEVYDPINKTTTKAYNYTCIDYIDKVEYKDIQVDCIKTGAVNVSGKIYEGNDAYCKLEGDRVCCYSNKEGGRYAATERIDGSVDQECKDLITGKIELISSSGKRFIK